VKGKLGAVLANIAKVPTKLAIKMLSELSQETKDELAVLLFNIKKTA